MYDPKSPLWFYIPVFANIVLPGEGRTSLNIKGSLVMKNTLFTGSGRRDQVYLVTCLQLVYRLPLTVNRRKVGDIRT